MVHESLPIGTIQDAVLEFLRGRDDAVLFGAQAVNAYAGIVRASEDVDIMSNRARELAEELRRYLGTRFHIAVRMREIREGIGFRLYQLRKPKNRHLVDVRPVEHLPPARRRKGILVIAPEELIAGKVRAFLQRRGKPKSGTDWRDLATLLLTFPELKKASGPVADRLHDDASLAAWKELVATEIQPEDDEDEFA